MTKNGVWLNEGRLVRMEKEEAGHGSVAAPAERA